jgi:hypothetical protein
MASLLGAVVTPIFLSRRYLGHSGITDHAIVGVLALAIIVAHLIQRRKTVRRLLRYLLGQRSSTVARSRQAVSDLILWVLTLNATVSGGVDLLVGHETYVPVPGPFLFHKWHELSALALVVDVVLHVVRRRARLRTSRVR